MKHLALLVALLCGSYHVQAQAYVITTDSTAKITHSITLNVPFIGIIELETASYAFQQATIPFQIPVVNEYSKRFSYPKIDTLVSSPRLPMEQKGSLRDDNSLDTKG